MFQSVIKWEEFLGSPGLAAGDQSEGPAVGAVHRVPRGMVLWDSGQREPIVESNEGKIVWGQSWALFWRPREAN